MSKKAISKKLLGSLLSIAVILSTVVSNVSEVKAAGGSPTLVTSITSTLDYSKLSSVNIGGTVPANIIYEESDKVTNTGTFSIDCDGAGEDVYIGCCRWLSRLSGSNGSYEAIYDVDQINSSNMNGVTNEYPQGTFNPSCEYAFGYEIFVVSKSDYEFDPSITATCNGTSIDLTYIDSEDILLYVGLGTVEEIQNKAGKSGESGSSGSSSGSDTSYEPHYTWQIGEDASSTEDGWLVLRDGLEGRIIARQRISSYPKYIEECTNKINKASDGNTVTVSSSSWNAFPKSVFEELAEKTDCTLVIEFVYKHKKYRTTIKANDIDKDNLKDYYGPETLIALFPTEEIGTVNY